MQTPTPLFLKSVFEGIWTLTYERSQRCTLIQLSYEHRGEKWSRATSGLTRTICLAGSPYSPIGLLTIFFIGSYSQWTFTINSYLDKMSKTFCCSSSWTTIAETERFERSHQLSLTWQFSKLLTSPNGGLHSLMFLSVSILSVPTSSQTARYRRTLKFFQNTIFYNFQVCFFICCKYSFSGRKKCRSPYGYAPYH